MRYSSFVNDTENSSDYTEIIEAYMKSCVYLLAALALKRFLSYFANRVGWCTQH